MNVNVRVSTHLECKALNGQRRLEISPLASYLTERNKGMHYLCVCVCVGLGTVVLFITVTSLQEVPGVDSLWPLCGVLMYHLTFCSTDVVTAAVSHVSSLAVSSTDITMYQWT